MAMTNKRAQILSLAEQAYIKELFDEHYDKLYRVAYRHLGRLCVDCIDDVIQETFKRACENFRSLASYDSAEAWLVNVCHHVAVDEVKYLCRVKELVTETQTVTSDNLGIDELLPSTLSEDNKDLWLSLLVSHPKVLKMGQHIVQNKGMTPKREKMRHVKETEDAPE